MKINDKLLDKMSQLSALYLKEEEKAEIKVYLKKNLSYFEKIREIDTQGIPPLVSPLSPPLVLREDKEVPFSRRKDILDSAPKKEGNLVKAPPTV